jgi:hypothetical protein
MNPRGKIPALRTDEGVLTENVAILTYIARTFPQARLLPEEPVDMAGCISHMAYLSNTVHPAFTHIVRPGRFATDESAQESVKATGRENAWKLLHELDGLWMASSGCAARAIPSPTPTHSSSTAGASTTVCRWSSSRITPLSRTACCSARQFGPCSCGAPASRLRENNRASASELLSLASSLRSSQ